MKAQLALLIVALAFLPARADETVPLHLREKTGAPAPADAEEPPLISSELLIQFKPGTDVEAFARRRGLVIKHTLRSDPNMFVLKAASVAAAREQMLELPGDLAVRAAYYNIPSRNVRMSFAPNDPFFNTGSPPSFPGQWHLAYSAQPNIDSNVRPAWNRNLTGAGVIIGICDDGVETAHPDLLPNYIAAHSHDFADNDFDPNPVLAADNHGTSVAGVAAARGGNGIGVTGAAPFARIAGLRLPFGGQNQNNQFAFVDVLKYHSFGANRSIKVKNHSYGVPSPFSPSAAERDAVAESAAVGTIHVVAAGNDRDKTGEDSNKKAFQSSPHVISVAAFGSSGTFASYSCFGANVFVTAPSSSFRAGEFGITTTDRTGGAGYNPGSGNNPFPDTAYTGDFGGTSSAAPLVAGVMALGVQANTNLNGRLAKHLLARTSKVVHANDNSATSAGGWKTNAAGFRFNPNFGFGLIDADAFTQMAPQFSGVTALETASIPLTSVNAAIPDAGQASRTFTVSATRPLEEVEVFFAVQHTFRGDLEADLTSPSGTTSRVFIRNGNDNRPNLNWWFTVNAFWGENPAGTWTLTLKDAFQGDTGTWQSYEVRLRMGEPIPAATTTPPTIAGFTPPSGPAGTAVTINGTKFSDVTAVTFNGVSASSFTVHSATQITATVPAGAATGLVRVVTPSGTATSAADFQVTAAPVISSFQPASGSVGTSVTIVGANFTGATAVTFNNINAGSFNVDSPTQITAVVPPGASNGRINVVTPAGSANSASNFIVSNAPLITSFQPATGPIGGQVVISGANFSGVTAVHFNGVPSVNFTVNSTTQITATVPGGATTGPVSVSTSAGAAQSAGDFTVMPPPVISNFTPGVGPVGATVLISGSHFTGANAVRFNGITAAFSVDSETQISAAVPAGATTGPITVATPSGSAASSLAFEVASASANDAFGGAQTLSGDSGTVTGSNQGASKQAGEPDHAGNPGGKSVWFQWTAPNNGTWTFDTFGSNFDTLLAVYTGGAVNGLTAIAANDDSGDALQSRVTFAATGGTVYRIAVDGFNFDAASPLNAASGDISLNWRPLSTPPVISGFTPGSGPIGTTVSISGSNLEGATAVSFNNVGAESFSVLSATLISADVPAGASSGLVRVTTPAGVAASAQSFTITTGPANDHFGSAQSLAGASGTAAGANTGATRETGEPNHAGQPGGASVWFTWTAPSTGKWSFDTAGSTFDTMLAVYTGGSVSALTHVASNDDVSESDRTSRVTFDALGGVVYRIAVDGYIGLMGNFLINWHAAPDEPVITGFSPQGGPAGMAVGISGQNLSGATTVSFNGISTTFTVQSATQISATVPVGASTGTIRVTTPNGIATSANSFVITAGPPNDDFVNAQVLAGNAAIVRGSNFGATREAGEPDHVFSGGDKSVWYRWTAPSSGTWTVETSGSSFDTVLAVYTGSSVGGLVLVAADDDSGQGFASRAVIEATGGTPYRIAVDGYDGDDGNVVLKLHPAQERTVIYATGFEPEEGYNANLDLAGQQGWLQFGSGGNGLIDSSFAGLGQSAYVGFSPPAFGDNLLFLWQPLDYIPPISTAPIVQFSVRMEVADSTDYIYDEFEWVFFNMAGDDLFAINFDNFDLGIYYVLDDGQSYVYAGRDFQNDRFYHLVVTLDFARNRWRATLDGNLIAAEQPISTSGAALTLGDIDALWIAGSLAGNNFMVFDDYEVVALRDEAPVLWLQPQSQTVSAGSELFLGVVAGGEFLSYQWRHDGADLEGQTNAFLSIREAAPAHAGTYDVTVSNLSGSEVSAPAVISVGALAVASARLTGTLMASGHLHLQITGTPGVVYLLETSGDLVNWTSVATLSSPNGLMEFTDTATAGAAAKFYRARF